MAWGPSSDIPLRGSHAPRVGAGESRAAAATRRVESASATAAADGDGPDLLDRVVEALEELAEFLAGGAARDRGAVAPPGLQALLGMEESTPMGSARDWEGPAGSDTADEPRESAVGCAEDPRRAVEARPDCLADDGVEVHGPASEAAVAGVANILPSKTRLSQRSCVVRTDRLFGRSWSDGLGSFFGHSAPRFARAASWRWRISRCGSNSPCGKRVSHGRG